MKKDNLLTNILGIVGLVAILCAFLFPIGPGLVTTYGEAARGYDFVFGNELMQLNDPHGLAICWFVLLIIGAFFGIVGLITGLFGSKFGAFLNFVAGLCLLVCAIAFFVSPAAIGNWWLADIPNQSASLGWGYLAAGIASAVGAVADLVGGGKVLFFSKAK